MKIELQQTVELELRQELALKLEQTMALVLDLNEQKKAIEAALGAEKETLEKLRVETGQDKLQVGEYKFSLVRPTSSRITDASLLAVGVTAKQIAAAKQKIPGTPYIKVSRATDKEVMEGE